MSFFWVIALEKVSILVLMFFEEYGLEYLVAVQHDSMFATSV